MRDLFRFLAAQVEIDLVCKCLDNIKLTMDDLKKACDESSKETTPESVAVVTVTRLKLRNDVKSRRGRREKCRNLLRGELFYDDAYYHLRILGSRD